MGTEMENKILSILIEADNSLDNEINMLVILYNNLAKILNISGTDIPQAMRDVVESKKELKKELFELFKCISESK